MPDVQSRIAASRQQLSNLSAEQRSVFEQCVTQFEIAWHQSPPPELQAYIPDVDDTLKQLIANELDAIDQEFRQASTPTVGVSAMARGEETIELDLNLEVTARYANLRRLTQGGLGDIFIADDRTLGRCVVIKRLKRRWQHDARALRWFLQEAEIISCLEHPGIIPIHARGTASDGLPWYSMRLIEGATLKQQIQSLHSHEKALDQYHAELRRLLGCFITASRTIAYAHSRGVIHRDLKPENIMLGPFGETIVLDWGMAKRSGAHHADETARSTSTLHNGDTFEEYPLHTVTGDMLGTPAYMSPEQANGLTQELGPATDIFGLGAVLYAILCGHGPFHAPTAAEATALARNCAYPRLGKMEPRMPKELVAICNLAMSLRPEDRYSTALELVSDVENYLADQPIRAMRSAWSDRLRRQFRQHQRMVAATTAIAVVLPVVVSLASWQLSKLQSQKRAAEAIAQARDDASHKVADYLAKTFQSADPIAYDAPGFQTAGPRLAGITLRRMLDNGHQLIQTHLLDNPELRVQLLASIGNSYRGLAEYERSRLTLDECWAVTYEHFPRESTQACEVAFHMARLEHDLGNYAQAEKLYRQVISVRERLTPVNALAISEAQYHLAWLLFHQPMGIDLPQYDSKMVEEATTLFQRVLKTRRELLPKNDRGIGLALVGLAAAEAAGYSEHFDETAANEAAEIFNHTTSENMVGKVHMDYLKAELLRKAKKYEEADALYIQIYELMQSHLGPSQPIFILHMWNMASLYGEMQAADKSEAMISKIRELARSNRALRSCPAHVDGLIQYGNLWEPLDAAKAREVYTEALGFARQRPEQNAKLIMDLERRLSASGQ